MVYVIRARLIWLCIFCIASIADVASAERVWGDLSFTPCALKTDGLPLLVNAQCTKITVAENALDSDGRKIDLSLAWVPSESLDASPDPVVMLAGGPGQSAKQSYPLVASAFQRILKTHAILLVDQRGTGESQPLPCAHIAEDALVDSVYREENIKYLAQTCQQALSKSVDLRFYTTTDAVQDLETVRQAVHAPALNLVGISYGTRVALEYLRRYPQYTRTVVLDSVVPPELFLGNDHARNLQDALTQQFKLCKENKACHARFGDTQQTLDQLYQQLEIQPVLTQVRHPKTNVYMEQMLTAEMLVNVVRMFAYAPSYASLLPLTLAETAQGRYDTLVVQSLMLDEMLGESIALGMHFSVTCSEDVEGIKANSTDEQTLLGNVMIQTMQEACSVWPRGDVPKDFHQPVSSDKPVLILSGELDPVTPPRYGEQVVKTLTKGRHFIASGMAHQVMSSPCVAKIMQQFIAHADTTKLETDCLETMHQTPQFIGFYGWEP